MYLKFILQWLWVYTQSCAIIITFNFRASYHPKRNFMSVNSQSWVTTSLHFLELPILDISYKWNDAIYGPLWLTSFIWYDILKAHPISICHLNIYNVKAFSLILEVVFIFLIYFEGENVSILMKSNLAIFFFFSLCFYCHIKEIIVKSRVIKIFPPSFLLSFL